jgi:hypothetical protein
VVLFEAVVGGLQADAAQGHCSEFGVGGFAFFVGGDGVGEGAGDVSLLLVVDEV